MDQVTRLMRVRTRLIQGAKAGKTTKYSEFFNRHYGCVRGEGAPHKIGDVLYEICKMEHSAKRPLLSAICVLKATGMPSSGFWGLEFIPELIRNGTKAERRQWWQCERDRVFDYWQRHDP